MLRSPYGWPLHGGYMAVTWDPLLRSPPTGGAYMTVTSDPLLHSPRMHGGYIIAVTSDPLLCNSAPRAALASRRHAHRHPNYTPNLNPDPTPYPNPTLHAVALLVLHSLRAATPTSTAALLSPPPH